MNRHLTAPSARFALTVLATFLVGGLTACGGGSESAQSSSAPSAADSANVSAADDQPSPIAAAARTELEQTVATPYFHMAAALPPEPTGADEGGTNVSANATPQTFSVDESLANIDTTRLTIQTLSTQLDTSAWAHIASASTTTPQTTTAITGAVYTPAQIRAAYGLPALPATGTAITSTVAATLGAGQTIYLIDAYHDATALADLNTFSTKFGLPTCTAASIATTVTLPLPTPPSTCTVSVVYSTGTGMTASAPAYNSGWAPESKLDVQWAHAIAPLARIVLIESPDANSDSLLNSVTLAGRMGPGVVSMSFGAVETSWSSAYDSYFAATGMTYIAAAGDVAAKVNWPAVSAKVLSVGGTGLNWSGSGTRYEAVWSSTSGGISTYAPVPAWQSGIKVAGAALTKRAVPDVAFNANPYTGQYVAITPPGSTSTTWSAMGGTSISSPQWAGVIAVANAIRVANSKSLLGDVHSLIYTTIGGTSATYASTFADIVNGNDGTCATCAAAKGFDTTTGWGTPNISSLLSSLTGVSSTASTLTSTSTSAQTSTSTVVATAVAPVVPGDNFFVYTGTVLWLTLRIKAPAGVTTTYSLSGAPAGMTVTSNGILSWPKAAAGIFPVLVTARTSAGASATGTYIVHGI